MRFAILSDIHANLQAWNAVLVDLRCNRVDKIVCLGDIVGYGPNPAEVLKSVHSNVDFMLLGNHDAVVCGKLDASLFNEDARKIITWTCGRLNREAVRFLGSLPLSLSATHFRCAHGDFSQPAAFHYVIDPEDARPSWAARPEPLLFIGHTHQPAIHVLGPSGVPHAVEPQDFEMEEGKRYLVNVGSVGQPRDGEPRACYCIYDSTAGCVYWRRVPFDLDAYRAALEQAGLPAKPSYFLRHDPRVGRPPLRELLNFSPPSHPGQVARDVVEVRSMETLQRRVRRWRTLFVLLLAAVLAGAAAGGGAWWRHSHRALLLEGGSMVEIEPSAAAPDANLLAWPSVASAPGEPLAGWEIRIGHRRRQSARVGTTSDGGTPELVLTSSTARDELRLCARPIKVARSDKVLVQGLLRKSADFRGTLTAVVTVTRERDGRREDVDLPLKDPIQDAGDGWLRLQRTSELPAGAVRAQFMLRGNFTGSVAVRDLSLTLKTAD